MYLYRLAGEESHWNRNRNLISKTRHFLADLDQYSSLSLELVGKNYYQIIAKSEVENKSTIII